MRVLFFDDKNKLIDEFVISIHCEQNYLEFYPEDEQIKEKISELLLSSKKISIYEFQTYVKNMKYYLYNVGQLKRTTLYINKATKPIYANDYLGYDFDDEITKPIILYFKDKKEFTIEDIDNCFYELEKDFDYLEVDKYLADKFKQTQIHIKYE